MIRAMVAQSVASDVASMIPLLTGSRI
jgi:hypothetical protein